MFDVRAGIRVTEHVQTHLDGERHSKKDKISTSEGSRLLNLGTLPAGAPGGRGVSGGSPLRNEELKENSP